MRSRIPLLRHIRPPRARNRQLWSRLSLLRTLCRQTGVRTPAQSVEEVIDTAANLIPPTEIRIFPIWGNSNLVVNLGLGTGHALCSVEPKLLLIERSRNPTQSYDAGGDFNLQSRDGPGICCELALNPVSQLLIGRFARRRANR